MVIQPLISGKSGQQTQQTNSFSSGSGVIAPIISNRTPTVQQPTVQPTPQPQPQQHTSMGNIFSNIVSGITGGIKAADNGVLNMLHGIFPQQPTVSPLPQGNSLSQRIGALPAISPNQGEPNFGRQSAPSAQISNPLKPTPNGPISNVQQALENPDNLWITKPLADFQKNVLTPVFSYQPKTTAGKIAESAWRGLQQGVTQTYLGGSKQVMDTFNMPLDKPATVGQTVAHTTGDIVGSVLSYIAGGEVLSGLKLGKATLPVLFAALGQTSSPVNTTILQRLEKLPVDTIAGFLFSKIPQAKTLLGTIGTTAKAGSIATGQGLIDNVVQGMKPKDAAIAAAKMGVIAGLFHIAAGGMGLLTESQSKSGTITLTPEEVRDQVINTQLRNTEMGNELMKAAFQAEVQGKNIAINMDATRQSPLANVLHLKTPSGISVQAELVDASAPEQITAGTETKAQPEAEIATTQQTGEEKPAQAPEQAVTTTNTENLPSNSQTKSSIPVPENVKPAEKPYFDYINKNYDTLAKQYTDKYSTRINTDDIKEFLKPAGYNSGKQQTVVDAHRAAGAFAYQLFQDALNHPANGEHTMLQTIGGTGSGKTSVSLDTQKNNSPYGIINDTTSQNYQFTKEAIQQALDKGFQVDVKYVHRPALDAFSNGVLLRDRHVSMESHVVSHTNAPDNYLRLYEDFKDNHNAHFEAFHNEPGQGYRQLSLDEVKKIKYNPNDLKQQIHERLEKHYQQRGNPTHPDYREKLTQDKYDSYTKKPNVSGVAEKNSPKSAENKLAPHIQEQVDLVREALYSGDTEAAAALYGELKGQNIPTLEKLQAETEKLYAANQKELVQITKELQQEQMSGNPDDSNNQIMQIARELQDHFSRPRAKFKITGTERTYQSSDGKTMQVGGNAAQAFDKLIHATDIEGFKKNIRILHEKFDSVFTSMYDRIRSGAIDGANYDHFRTYYESIQGTRLSTGNGKAVQNASSQTASKPAVSEASRNTLQDSTESKTTEAVPSSNENDSNAQIADNAKGTNELTESKNGSDNGTESTGIRLTGEQQPNKIDRTAGNGTSVESDLSRITQEASKYKSAKEFYLRMSDSIRDTLRSKGIRGEEALTDFWNKNAVKSEPILDSLNPTGSLYADYSPQSRMTMKLGKNITTYDKTAGLSPDELVTIYRGASKNHKTINPGDFITTNPDVAKSYTGDGNVLQMDVPASHILDDKNEPLGDEYIYRPQFNAAQPAIADTNTDLFGNEVKQKAAKPQQESMLGTTGEGKLSQAERDRQFEKLRQEKTGGTNTSASPIESAIDTKQNDELHGGGLFNNLSTDYLKTYGEHLVNLKEKSGTSQGKLEILAQGSKDIKVRRDARAIQQLLDNKDYKAVERKLNDLESSGTLESKVITDSAHDIIGEPAGNTTSSVTLNAGINPGLDKFFAEEVSPAVRTITEAGRESYDLINPPTASEAARVASNIVRKALANISNYQAVNSSKFNEYRKFFRRYSDDQNIKNISTYERTGQFNKEPKLVKGEKSTSYSDLYHKSMMDSYAVLRAAYGKDEEGFIENYVRRAFIFDSSVDQAKGTSFLNNFHRSLSANKSPLKQRVLDMPLDEAFRNMRERGIKVRMATTNPEELRQWSLTNARRALVYAETWKSLKAAKLIAFVPKGKQIPDGYTKLDDRAAQVFAPAEVHYPEGNSKPLEFQEQGYQTTLQMGSYYADPTVARILNNTISSGFESNKLFRAGRQMSNSMNQLQLGLSAFHFTGSAINAGVSDVALGMRNLLEGKPIEAVTRITRGLVPFASMARYTYQGQKLMTQLTANSPEAAQVLEKYLNPAGGRLAQETRYNDGIVKQMNHAFLNGNLVGGLIRVPHAFVEAVSHLLMTYLIPRIKVGAFLDLAENVNRRLPADATAEMKQRAYASAWNSIDNRFGQLVYDNLFWNKAGKDVALLATRSVGWNLGTERELGGGILVDPIKATILNKGTVNAKKFTERITDRTLYAFGLIFSIAMLGALYEYLHTGKAPKELKDYFFPRDGGVDKNGNPTRKSLPSYVKDLYAYSQDPVGTILHKSSPLFDMLSSLVQNKDYYGNMIRNPNDPTGTQLAQTGSFLLHLVQPFSIQQLLQQTQDGATLENKLESFFGLVKAPGSITQSAEQKAASAAYQQIHGERGAQTPEQVQIQNLKNKAREEIKQNGWHNSPSFKQLMQNGTLKTQQQRRNFLRSAAQTSQQRLESHLPKAVRQGLH